MHGCRWARQVHCLIKANIPCIFRSISFMMQFSSRVCERGEVMYCLTTVQVRQPSRHPRGTEVQRFSAPRSLCRLAGVCPRVIVATIVDALRFCRLQQRGFVTWSLQPRLRSDFGSEVALSLSPVASSTSHKLLLWPSPRCVVTPGLFGYAVFVVSSGGSLRPHKQAHGGACRSGSMYVQLAYCATRLLDSPFG